MSSQNFLGEPANQTIIKRVHFLFLYCPTISLQVYGNSGGWGDRKRRRMERKIKIRVERTEKEEK
jgi:hypothetical protein